MVLISLPNFPAMQRMKKGHFLFIIYYNESTGTQLSHTIEKGNFVVVEKGKYF